MERGVLDIYFNMCKLVGKGNIMLNIFKNLISDTSGASAAEYALILAIVGSAIALAAVNLGGTISKAMNDASTCISAKTC